MKLASLDVERFGMLNRRQFEGLGSGINFVHGPSGVGKSTLRHLIRAILYGLDDDQIQSLVAKEHQGEIGAAEFQVDEQFFRMSRLVDESVGGQSMTYERVPGNEDELTTIPETLQRDLAEVDLPAYTAMFNVSFEEKRNLVGRIVSALRNRLGVASGESGQFDRTAYDYWQREQAEFQARLKQLEQSRNQLDVRRRALESEKNQAESNYQNAMAQAESDIQLHSQHVSRLQTDLDQLLSRQATIQSEIEGLNYQIEQLKQDVKFVPVDEVSSGRLTQLYQLLDQNDDQLELWFSIREKIQQQREVVRDELRQSRELDLENIEHPYHESQNLISKLEYQLESTEVRSRHWLAHLQGDGTSGLVEDMADQCVELRQHLQSLCEEISAQFLHVNHRTAIGELKQLRLCHQHICENIELVEARRNEIINQIRRLDSRGADAVLRTDEAFRDYAKQNGTLNARVHFFGPIDQLEPGQLYRRIAADYSNEARRRDELVAELNANESKQNAIQGELIRAHDKLNEALQRRDFLVAPAAFMAQPELDAILDEMASLNGEMESIRLQLNPEAPAILRIENPVIDEASAIFQRLTNSSYSRVWLESASPDVSVRNREGVAMPFGNLPRTEQSLACLALILAGVQEFSRRGIELPVCLDELFENVDAARTNPILRELQSVVGKGIQLFVFSQREIDVTAARFAMPYHRIHLTRSSDVMLSDPAPVTNGPVRFTTNMPHHQNGNHTNGIHTNGGLPKAQHISAIDQSTLLRNTSLLDEQDLDALRQSGIHTVADLLDVDPDLLSPDLTRLGISSDSINRWQSQFWLKISIPELSTQDTILLVLCGINDPILFDEIDDETLALKIEEYCQAESAGGFSSDRYSTKRLQTWRDSFSRNRSLWRNHNRYQRRTRQRRRWADDRPATPSPAETASKLNETTPLKFYLSLSDDLEAAPSIGPRTAERFADIGVATIQDFLDGSSQKMADDLGYKRIKEKDIANWQNQTKLVCQIPNLRGHDAQLLVACDFNTPESVANMSAEELLEIVGPFSKTKDGLKILRQSKAPDLEEVTNWIEWAKQTRSLTAAA